MLKNQLIRNNDKILVGFYILLIISTNTTFVVVNSEAKINFPVPEKRIYNMKIIPGMSNNTVVIKSIKFYSKLKSFNLLYQFPQIKGSEIFKSFKPGKGITNYYQKIKISKNM